MGPYLYHLLAFRTILRASTDSIHSVLGKEQFGVCYPGGAEACKLGLEATLINSKQAFLWIDSTNAFNTMCRTLIKEAITLFVPQCLNNFRVVLRDQGQMSETTPTAAILRGRFAPGRLQALPRRTPPWYLPPPHLNSQISKLQTQTFVSLAAPSTVLGWKLVLVCVRDVNSSEFIIHEPVRSGTGGRQGRLHQLEELVLQRLRQLSRLERAPRVCLEYVLRVRIRPSG